MQCLRLLALFLGERRQIAVQLLCSSVCAIRIVPNNVFLLLVLLMILVVCVTTYLLGYFMAACYWHIS